MLEPTDTYQKELRRYVGSDKCTCPSRWGYHNASVAIGETKDATHASDYLTPPEDTRWPTKCECGYEFKPDDIYQTNNHLLYKRSDTGELITLQNTPVGAMWYATGYKLSKEGEPPRYGFYWDNQTTPPLFVKLHGGGEWNIDSRASNCTRPDDKTHRCWVRTGTPGQPDFTVGKSGGDTCAAGAGSILMHDWHGFLRNGELVT